MIVQPPKVISGPQIGKGSSKIDISHVQAYLNNLKLQNAAASAGHSNSTGGLKINQQQSTSGSSGSGSSSAIPLNFSSMVAQNQQQIVYARSTSRGKEHAGHYS